MTRDELIRLLTEHRGELEQFGVKTLAIFSSAARNEAWPESDVDILVEFTDSGTFDRYMGLKEFLESLLGREVDLVTRKALKPRLKPYVESEAIYVP